MKPISSVISGFQSLAQPVSNSTGQQLGALGSAEQEKARQWLKGKTPAQVDGAIRHSLMCELGVGLKEVREWRFPEDKPAYQVVTSVGVTVQSTDSLPKAIRKLETAMTPVSRSEAEDLVAQMQSVLARRNSSEGTAEVAFDVYVHVLMQHPADVVTEAVRQFIMEPRKDGSSWFPAPPELEARCRTLASPRQALLAGLTGYRIKSPEQIEAERLEQVYRRDFAKAQALSLKVGPGPATDTGARGERIAAWKEAQEAASAAREVWLDAEKALQA